ncbi:hypothetical protein ACH5RR_000957 [Cinchona calisaya]|uniref:beta-glucosidase n=1 Tax=Cinchona calisaya TaxID=153742 RepID=A0ABD3B2K6_9GENT
MASLSTHWWIIAYDQVSWIASTMILTTIRNTVDPTPEIGYSREPNTEYVKSNNFGYAIIVVGELPYSKTFGDSLNLTIP